MASPKIIAAAAVTGALALGGLTGAVLGVPGVSGAEKAATPTSTTVAAGPSGQNGGQRAAGPGRGMRGGAGLDAAAKVLGISADDLRTELQGGKSLADVAKEKGVDKQKLIDALVADATTRLDQEKAKLPDQIAKMVDGKMPMGPSGQGGGFGGRGGPGGRGGQGMQLPAAAKALGLSEADLQTALKGGKSLADVAKDKGVSEQTVIDAMVAAAKDRIATDVKDGHLTQDQADKRIAEMPARIKDAVEHAGGMRGPGGHGGPGHNDGNGTDGAAPDGSAPGAAATPGA